MQATASTCKFGDCSCSILHTRRQPRRETKQIEEQPTSLFFPSDTATAMQINQHCRAQKNEGRMPWVWVMPTLRTSLSFTGAPAIVTCNSASGWKSRAAAGTDQHDVARDRRQQIDALHFTHTMPTSAPRPASCLTAPTCLDEVPPLKT